MDCPDLQATIGSRSPSTGSILQIINAARRAFYSPRNESEPCLHRYLGLPDGVVELSS